MVINVSIKIQEIPEERFPSLIVPIELLIWFVNFTNLCASLPLIYSYFFWFTPTGFSNFGIMAFWNLVLTFEIFHILEC